MNIDSKLPGFKSFMSENRLNNGGVKTTIDQSAVAPSEQNNVKMDMDLDENGQPKDKAKKKKKAKDDKLAALLKADDTPKKSDTDIKKQNLRLLNLL